MINFHLNMKLLKDIVSDQFAHVTLFSSDDTARLESVRLCQQGQTLLSQYLYVLSAADLPQLPSGQQQICFLVAGRPDLCFISPSCSYLIVEDDTTVAALLALAQETFEQFTQWNQDLYTAMTSERPLDEMLSVSLKFFHNPLLVHDSNFFILSCPHQAPGLPEWEKDSRTGQDIIPLSMIQDFKTDPEYLSTLTTTQAALFSRELMGYPILYINLWNDGRYEGRILVDELESPIRPGQYLLITHLARLITTFLKSSSLLQLGIGKNTEEFFCSFLNGTIQDQSSVMNVLHFLNWKRNDRYLCLHIEATQQNIRMLSSIATINHIEMQIPECRAFIHNNGITVLVNLSYSHAQIPDVLSRLAILLREGLLKMGASSEIHDFLLLPQGYQQAQMALELGQKSTSMNWCFRFDDYILEFLLSRAGETLSPELLCSGKLLILKKYDEENNTELYQTLKVYLESERAVLQSAKALFIHRSTLLYRLERIEKLTNVNFEDPKERLVLQLSFHILEQGKES
jgi:hypothetical protein